MELKRLRTVSQSDAIKRISELVDDHSVGPDNKIAEIRELMSITHGSTYVAPWQVEEYAPKIEQLQALTPSQLCNLVDALMDSDPKIPAILFHSRHLDFFSGSSGDGTMRFQVPPMIVRDSKAVTHEVRPGRQSNYRGTDTNDGYSLWFYDNRKGSAWEKPMEQYMATIPELIEALATMPYEKFIKKAQSLKVPEKEAPMEVDIEMG